MSAPVRFQVRPASAGDVESVQQFWDECGLGRASADEMHALMTNASTAIFVAPEGNRVLGTAVASFDGWRAYVYHVAVAPSARGQGLGHQLMEEAERHLARRGARYVYVMVNQDNTEGLALIGATGYLPEGEIVLTKHLPAI